MAAPLSNALALAATALVAVLLLLPPAVSTRQLPAVPFPNAPLRRAGITRLRTALPALPPFTAPGAGKPVPGDASKAVVYWPGIKGFDGPLAYYGGQLFVNPLNVHILFYGAWDKNGGKDQAVVTNFISSLSDAGAGAEAPTVRGWWKTVTLYTDAATKEVSPDVKVGSTVVVADGYKKQLNDMQNGQPDDIFGLVQEQITAGNFPADPTALYVVLTSDDVLVGDSTNGYGGGFCGQYCGYHYVGDTGAAKLSYIFVGSPTQCPEGCASYYKKSKGVTPNGFPAADSAISILGHELAEAATDGYMNGWKTTGRGWENGDVCAWTFTDSANPEVLQGETGYYYNLQGANGMKYLVQTMPNPFTSTCLVSS